MATIQEEMIAFRAKNNLSQTKAAKLANITPITWNSVERGIQNPSTLTIAKIRLAMGGKEDNESINQQN